MDLINQFFKRRNVILLRKLRAFCMRFLLSRERYLALYSTKPISKKYGFDRGWPVDRLFIEKFLQSHQTDIRGVCLEVVDNTYTKKFGGDRVTISDVLDIFKTVKANIHGDLRNVRSIIKDNTYDTIILTQTLNVIDDYHAAISECHRILKPGGVLLVTVPTVSPAWNLKINFWRFSVEGAAYIFKKYFIPAQVEVTPLGNSVSSEAFWLGMAVEDFSRADLERGETSFPTIIGVKAIK